WVDGEGFAQFANAAADALLDLRIAFIAVPAHALDHFGDQAADLAELGRPEPAGRARRRPQANARGHERRARVERNAVLVAGQVSAVEALLGRLAGHILGREVDQHQVVVGPARDDPQARLLEARGERLGVLDHRLRVDLEFGPQRLAERDRLGGDHVDQGAALHAREYGGVELLRQLL